MKKFPYVPVLLGAAVVGGLVYLGTRKKTVVDRKNVPVAASFLEGAEQDRFKELQQHMRQAGFN